MNEVEFTKEIVIPTLQALGFVDVRYNGGPDELGKDVLFAEITRIGGKRHLGAQIKYGDISGGNNSAINDLVNHVERAFNMPVEDLITKKEVFLSELYVIIAGEFKGKAKDVLIRDARISLFRDRVHFISGSQFRELLRENTRPLLQAVANARTEVDAVSDVSQRLLASLEKNLIPYDEIPTDILPRLIELLRVHPSLADAARPLDLLLGIIRATKNLLGVYPIIQPIKGGQSERNLLMDRLKELLQSTIGVRVALTLIQELIQEQRDFSASPGELQRQASPQ